MIFNEEKKKEDPQRYNPNEAATKIPDVPYKHSMNKQEIEDDKQPIGVKKYDKIDKILFYIMLPFIIPVALSIFIVKIPIRLVVDLKDTKKDFLTRLDEVVESIDELSQTTENSQKYA